MQKLIYRAILQNVLKIVGYQIFVRITRFVTLVIRPDYQKFCLRSTPEYIIGCIVENSWGNLDFVLIVLIALSPCNRVFTRRLRLCHSHTVYRREVREGDREGPNRLESEV